MSSHTNTHRFLIVRLGALGDVVHGIPVAAALRERFPAARIDWMVDPRYVPLLGLVRGLDAAIPVDPRRGPGQLISTVRGLRDVRYAAAIDLQGLLKSAALARFAGAWQTIGMTAPHLREPMARLFYSERVDPGDAQHVIQKNLALLAPLGVKQPRVLFPLATPDSDAATQLQQRYRERRYVLINPGAAWPNKRWPADRFGMLAGHIRERAGLESVVLWGPGEEAAASAVVAASQGAASLAPRTTVVDLVAVARGAALMIAGDTGPLHVAAAAGTPVVALFGPTRVERNGPWVEQDIVVSRTSQCVCLYQRTCRRGQPCLDDVSVGEVWNAVERRLGRL